MTAGVESPCSRKPVEDEGAAPEPTRSVNVRAAGWRRPLLVLFASASLALAIQFAPALPHRAGSDFRRLYEPIARNIVAGHGLVDADGRLATRCPPGYPLILAAIYVAADAVSVTRSRALAVADALLLGLGSALLYGVACRIWGRRRGLLPAAAWATYPLAVWLLAQPNTEGPYTPVLFASVWLFWLALEGGPHTVRHGTVAGALCGLGALIRPFAAGVPCVLGLLLWLRARRHGTPAHGWAALALLLAYVATLVPWEVYAFEKPSRFIALSTAGVPTVRDGLTFGVNPKGYREGTPIPDDVTEVMQNIRKSTSNSGSIDEIAKAVGIEACRKPGAVAKLFAIKLGRCFYGTDSQRYEGIVFAMQLVYLSCSVYAGILCWRSGGHIRWLAVLAFALLTYSLGMDLAGASLARYLIPTIGVLFLVLPGAFPVARLRREAA